jgi:K+-sensing histidine kinase KdpD
MRTWNFRWYPVKDPSGEIFGVSVLVEDITERKRAESAAHFLEDATQQLAASLDYEQNLARVAELAVEHLSDVCVIDVFPNDGRVMRAATATKTPEASEFVSGIQLRDWRINGGNDTFGARILRGQEFFVADVTEEWLQEHAPGPSQVGAARALDATSLLAIPLRVKGEVVGAFTLVMAGSGRKFSQQDQALARELATRLAFAVENSRLFDEAQQALAALRESDEWLRAANAAKDEFLSLVSHELRTPITTILGNASVIQRHGRQLAEDDLASAIGDIHHDASRLNGIIDNLLALARLERGQQVEVEPLVLRRIARRVVESHRSEHPDREYRVAFPEEMILVEGNAVYMEQVLRNLLSNAERYSPEGSPIDIEATRSNGTLRFSVMDRGVGIDPDEAQKLFEPFFRSSRTSGMKGIGVGLAVCKRLVEFQGGTLVAAAREGGGSVFTVSLPVTSLDEQES